MSLNSLGTSNGVTAVGSRMTHSLSTPSGVDGSAAAVVRTGGKKLAVRVQMLDDSMTLFQVQVRNFYLNPLIFGNLFFHLFRQKLLEKFSSSRSVDSWICWKQIISDWSILKLQPERNIGSILRSHSTAKWASHWLTHFFVFVSNFTLPIQHNWKRNTLVISFAYK